MDLKVKYKCKLLNVLQNVKITPYRSPLPEALDAGRINILKSVMYFPFFLQYHDKTV